MDDTHKILLNNSIDDSTQEEYAAICDLYGFTEVRKDNIGICGGRQWVAEHFDKMLWNMWHKFSNQ